MSDLPSIVIGALIGLAVGVLLSVVAQEGALDNTWIGRTWRVIKGTHTRFGQWLRFTLHRHTLDTAPVPRDGLAYRVTCSVEWCRQEGVVIRALATPTDRKEQR